MKTILSVLALVLVNLAASAQTNLYTTRNGFGGETTTGSINGQRVSLYSSSNGFGGTSTTGSIGNSRVSTYSSSNGFGGTSTSGR